MQTPDTREVVFSYQDLRVPIGANSNSGASVAPQNSTRTLYTNNQRPCLSIQLSVHRVYDMESDVGGSVSKARSLLLTTMTAIPDRDSEEGQISPGPER